MNNVPPSEDVDRLRRVLSGALRVWQVAGSVTADADEPRTFLIATDAGVRLAVHHEPARGWSIALQDPASGARMPIGTHAGLPGLLRSLRAELAPDAPSGRLIVAAA